MWLLSLPSARKEISRVCRWASSRVRGQGARRGLRLASCVRGRASPGRHAAGDVRIGQSHPAFKQAKHLEACESSTAPVIRSATGMFARLQPLRRQECQDCRRPYPMQWNCRERTPRLSSKLRATPSTRLGVSWFFPEELLASAVF